MLSKKGNNKKYAPKWVFFNKKNEKGSDDFWHRPRGTCYSNLGDRVSNGIANDFNLH